MSYYDDEDDDDPADWDDDVDDRFHDDPAIGDDDGREDAADDYVFWDDDLTPPKEEPDCYSCNDGGCRACVPHTNGCDCAGCADAHVAEYELFDSPDRDEAALNLVAFAFVDEPPF
ncbi:hypothetical protein SK571_13605 [Lentzea sp. BCCO 10_0798]|uniref:Metallothionein n=1 Tax=Lentzea kristufekii TaxID=3095430 RepID=A0ABU4TQ49_9PSEU|nr:hypothetical protein [Lentzea sp. BCCO 10_0798]MDX8050422.1 hypothetical protein [Lentzea sp. BCCO 10_0798]